jgi:LysR family nitrogen assimilation transcriptional regulator
MDYRVLHAFCDIAEHQSLTRAAAVLGESQSALSRRISALEGELGGRLFYRTGRGMALTELGERVWPRIRSILAETEALAREAQGERDNPSGTVEIGVVPGMSQPLISTLCARLRQQHPGIRLRALEGYSGQVEEWLANGRIELGVFNSYGRGAVRGAELLLQSRVAVVAPRGLFPDRGNEIPFAALRELPLALPPRPNTLVAALNDIAARQHFTLQIALEASTGSLIRDAVQHAGLCTVVPLYFAQRDYPDAEFSISRLVKPALQQKSWMLLSTQRPVTRAVRVVSRLVCEVAVDAIDERIDISRRKRNT